MHGSTVMKREVEIEMIALAFAGLVQPRLLDNYGIRSPLLRACFVVHSSRMGGGGCSESAESL